MNYVSRKRLLPSFKVCSPKDLSKKWFIYWNENGKRRKVKGGINKFRSFEERMAAVERVLVELKRTIRLQKTLPEKMIDWIEGRGGAMKLKGCRTCRSKIDVFLDWLGNWKVTNENLKLFFAELLRTRYSPLFNI